MGAHVEREVALLRKGGAAQFAGIGALAGVGADVFFEIAVSVEPGRTELALERAPARVFAKVTIHVSLLAGHVGALAAGMQSVLKRHE